MYLKLNKHIINILKMCMWGLMELEIILTVLRPFELSHCRQCFALRGMNFVKSTPFTVFNGHFSKSVAKL